MATGKYTYIFDAKLNADQVQKGLQDIQAAMNAISLPKDIAKGATSSINKILDVVNKIRGLSDTPLEVKDTKLVNSQIEALDKNLVSLRGYLKEIAGIDLSKLLPESIGQTIDKINSKIKDTQTALEKLKKSDAYKTVEKQISEKQKELKNLEGSRGEIDKAAKALNEARSKQSAYQSKANEANDFIQSLKDENKQIEDQLDLFKQLEEEQVKLDRVKTLNKESKSLSNQKTKAEGALFGLPTKEEIVEREQAIRDLIRAKAELEKAEKQGSKAETVDKRRSLVTSLEQKVGNDTLSEIDRIKNERKQLELQIQELDKKIQRANEEAAKIGTSRDLSKNVKNLQGQTSGLDKGALEGILSSNNAEIKQKEAELKQFNDEITKLSSSLVDLEDKYNNALKKNDPNNKLGQNIADLKSNIDALKTSLSDMEASASQTAFKNLEQTLAEVGLTMADITDTDGKLNAQLAETKLSEAPYQKVKALLEQIAMAEQEVVQGKEEIDRQGGEFNKLTAGAREFNQQLDQVKSRIAYFFGLGNAINLVRRSLQQALNTVKELDKVMTETAVVTSYTVGDMWNQLPKYTKTANELGVTTKGVYETMTLFYQMGLNTNEVFQVGTETMKMARIAGLDYATATSYMTAALKGFNMEVNTASAQRINDVYSKLAAISASDTQEISIAMTKVASLAASSNMELETTAAFLAKIVETTRESATTAGTSLKTVIARFGEVKKLYTEGQLMGTDEEGTGIDVNKISSALRLAGIDLNKFFLGEVGLDDVLLELASKWDNLTEVEQRYIATQAAGSRQQSRFLALMRDYARTQELVDEAYNSAGSSEEQFQKTQDSLETSLNRLTNAWNEFTLGLANNTAINSAINALTGLISVVNKFTSIFGGGWRAGMTGLLGAGTLLGGGRIFNSAFEAIKINRANGAGSTSFIQQLLGSTRFGARFGMRSAFSGTPDKEGNYTETVGLPKTGLFGGYFSLQNGTSRAAVKALKQEVEKVYTTENYDKAKKNYEDYYNKLSDKKQESFKHYTPDSRNSQTKENRTAYSLQQETKKEQQKIEDYKKQGYVLAGSQEAKARQRAYEDEQQKLTEQQAHNVASVLTQASIAASVLGSILSNNAKNKGWQEIGSGISSIGTALTITIPLIKTFHTALGKPLTAGALGGIGAAIAGIIGLIKIADYFIESSAEKAERVKQVATDMANASKEAENNSKEFTESFDAWKGLISNINGATQSTQELANSIAQANQSASDLINTYGLIYGKDWTYENGRITFNEEAVSARQEEAQNKATRLQNISNIAAAYDKEIQILDSISKEDKQLLSAHFDTINKAFEDGEVLREVLGDDETAARLLAYRDSKKAFASNTNAQIAMASLSESTASDMAKQFAVNQFVETTSEDLISAQEQKYGKNLSTLKSQYIERFGELTEAQNDWGWEKFRQVLAMDDLINSTNLDDYIQKFQELEIELSKIGATDIFDGWQDKNLDELSNKLNELPKNIKDGAVGDTLKKTIASITKETAVSQGKLTAEVTKFSKKNLAEIENFTTSLSKNQADEIFAAIDRFSDFGLEFQNQIYESFSGLKSSEGIQELYETLTSISGSSVIEALSEFESKLKFGASEAIKSIYNSLKGQTSEADLFSSLYTSDAFAEAEEDLNELIKTNGKISADNINELAKSTDILNKYLKVSQTNAAGLAKILTRLEIGDLGIDDISESLLKAVSAAEGLDSNLSNVYDYIDNYEEVRSDAKETGDFAKGLAEGALEIYEMGAVNDEKFLANITELFGESMRDKYLAALDKYSGDFGTAKFWDEMYTELGDTLFAGLNAVKDKETYAPVWDYWINQSGIDWKNSGISYQNGTLSLAEEFSTKSLVNRLINNGMEEKLAQTMVQNAKAFSPTIGESLRTNDYLEARAEFGIGKDGSERYFTKSDIESFYNMYKDIIKKTEESVNSFEDYLEGFKNNEKYLDLDSGWQKEGAYGKLDKALPGGLEGYLSQIEGLEKIVLSDSGGVYWNKITGDLNIAISAIQEFGVNAEQADAILTDMAKEGKFAPTIQGLGKVGDEIKQTEYTWGEYLASLNDVSQASVSGFQKWVADSIEIAKTQETARIFAEEFAAACKDIGINLDPSDVDTVNGILNGLTQTRTITLSLQPDGSSVKLNGPNGILGTYSLSNAAGGYITSPVDSLTGEEGTEIVWNKQQGYSYFVGNNGPEFAHLQRGDQVFNASQTKKILKNGINPLKSYASGTFGSLGNAYGPSGAYTTKSGVGGGTEDELEELKNELDWLYNLLQDIKELEKQENLLQEEYNYLLKDSNATGQQLFDVMTKQVGNLASQYAAQTLLLEKRQQEMREFMEQTNDIQGYARWNDARQEIEIDWEAIDKDMAEGLIDKDMYDHINDIIGKLEDIEDGIDDAEKTQLSIRSQLQEFQTIWRDSYVDFEKRVYEALVKQQQILIDGYSELNDTINNSNTSILDSLQKEINIQRQIRDNTKTEEEIADSEAQLAYLRRDTTGANEVSARGLEKDLEDQREAYEDTLVDQALDRLSEENDLAAQQRERQIEIMQAQLDYAENNGVYWPDVQALIEGAIGEDGGLRLDSQLYDLLNKIETTGFSATGVQQWGDELAKVFKEVVAWDRFVEAVTNDTFTDAFSAAMTPLTDLLSDYSQSTKDALYGKQSSGGGGGSSNSGSGYSGQSASPNDDIKKMQQMLGVAVDGIWGPESEAAYRAFQQASDEEPYMSQSAYELAKKYKSNFGHYLSGGLNTSTGLAWLDGTSSAPEYVLNAAQTQAFLQLADVLPSIMSSSSSVFNSSPVNLNLTMNVDEIASDYDVDRIADRVKDIIYDSSSYRSVNVLNFSR